MQAAQDNEKEEDLIERELLELSTPSRRLEASMRTTDAEMHQLHDKVAALEVELHGERQRHQEVVSKLEDLQEQIHRFVSLTFVSKVLVLSAHQLEKIYPYVSLMLCI